MQIYSCAELMSAAQALGGRVDFESGLPDTLPVLAGSQHVQAMNGGLVLYLSHSQDMVGGCSHNRLPSGLTASFLLHGQTELAIGNQQLHMDCRQRRNQAVMINLREEQIFQRYWQAGRQETKISLHLSDEWLSRQLDGLASPAISRLLRSHGQHHAWQPSAQLLQRAAGLLETDSGEIPLLKHLKQESFGLELAASILQSIVSEPDKPLPGAHLQRCVERLQQLLRSGEADDLSISQLARRLGTNAVDLQSAFQQVNGSSIGAWLRALRLQRAHQALLQRSVQVDVAASIAGYAHTSSFSAAFKRHYGVTPSRLRTPRAGSRQR